MKLFAAIILCLMLIGCGSLVKEINKVDLQAYEDGKEFARGRLYTWSYNSGFIDGFGLIDKMKFPIKLENENDVRAFIQSAPTLVGFSDLDTLAKKESPHKLCLDKDKKPIKCWNDLDYDLGKANGIIARLLLRSSIEAASNFIKEFAPDLAAQLLPLLKFLVIS
jgi:hypothetical protein